MAQAARMAVLHGRAGSSDPNKVVVPRAKEVPAPAAAHRALAIAARVGHAHKASVAKDAPEAARAVAVRVARAVDLPQVLAAPAAVAKLKSPRQPETTSAQYGAASNMWPAKKIKKTPAAKKITRH